MQQTMDLVVRIGQLAFVVIAVGIAVVLLISIIDRNPRSKHSPKDQGESH